jgi:hypothetical protein
MQLMHIIKISRITKSAKSSSRASQIHFSSAMPIQPAIRTIIAENSLLTKLSINKPDSVAITKSSINLNYSKILKYNNTSFALGDNGNSNLRIEKNSTATLNRSMSNWSRPLM